MEAKRIADQLRRSFHGDAWHGPAVLELLSPIGPEKVGPEKAGARPLPGAHNIWEIVLHIGAWQGAVLGGLEGKPVKLSAEQDWPAVTDTSPEAWKQTLDKLNSDSEELCRRISELTDAQLEERLPPKGYTLYFLLHGLVQHNLYHAGQIALLKKA